MPLWHGVGENHIGMEGDAQSQQQPLKPRMETEALVGSTGPAEKISSVWLDAWQVRSFVCLFKHPTRIIQLEFDCNGWSKGSNARA